MQLEVYNYIRTVEPHRSFIRYTNLNWSFIGSFKIRGALSAFIFTFITINPHKKTFGSFQRILSMDNKVLCHVVFSVCT